ncbi:MAG: hypothetical protein K2P99_07385 [Burkholderiales bacterium]|nr:hypothetical protein [Burkholderiales bacterium]
MLIEVISKILINKSMQPKIIIFDGYICQLYYHEYPSDFFIILDKQLISNDDLKQLNNEGVNILDEKVKSIIQCDQSLNRTYEKNSTLILCIDNNKIDDIIINDFEEDKYLFKKNIISYNLIELECLIELFDNHYTEDKANELINTDESFDRLKLNDNSGYALLTKLFIKLPFLRYCNHNRRENSENLSIIIQQEAKLQKLEYLYDKISNKEFNVDDINNLDDLQNILSMDV